LARAEATLAALDGPLDGADRAHALPPGGRSIKDPR
jgi:hypothetical protein